jgi:iron complex outermembrane receptor protein
LLQNLSSNTNGYAVAVGVGDSGTPGLSAAGLRGLGSTNTLVLLNGRRLSNYAFNASGGGTVNLNQIPLAAVERVESAEGRRSAIYGTDAIGGVINFILRKDYTGAEITRLRHDDGSWRRQHPQVHGGRRLRRHQQAALQRAGDVDYQKDTALKASQRKRLSRAPPIRPTWASPHLGQRLPGELRVRRPEPERHGGQRCIPRRARSGSTPRPAPRPPADTCRYDFTSVLDIFPPSERKAFFTRGAFQIANDHQIFASTTCRRTRSRSPRPKTPVNDFLGTGPFLYPAGGPFYPTTVTLPNGTVVRPTGDLPIAWRLKDGGLRTNRADSDESRFVVGAQGVLFGWDYNTAYTRASRKATDNYIDGWVRESVLKPRDAHRPDRRLLRQPADQPRAKALITRRDPREGARVGSRGQDHRRPHLEGALRDEERPARPRAGLRVSRGRAERPSGPGAVLGRHPRVAVVRFRRPAPRADVTAFFGELNIPLLKNLEAQIAVRFDDYSDFGNTTNPKWRCAGRRRSSCWSVARTARASALRRCPTSSCRASCRTRPTSTTTRSAARTPTRSARS